MSLFIIYAFGSFVFDSFGIRCKDVAQSEAGTDVMFFNILAKKWRKNWRFMPKILLFLQN
jgi:hypothetical protein